MPAARAVRRGRPAGTTGRPAATTTATTWRATAHTARSPRRSQQAMTSAAPRCSASMPAPPVLNGPAMCIAGGAGGNGPSPSAARAAFTCAAVAGWAGLWQSSIAAHRFSSLPPPLPLAMAGIGAKANAACNASWLSSTTAAIAGPRRSRRAQTRPKPNNTATAATRTARVGCVPPPRRCAPAANVTLLAAKTPARATRIGHPSAGSHHRCGQGGARRRHGVSAGPGGRVTCVPEPGQDPRGHARRVRRRQHRDQLRRQRIRTGRTAPDAVGAVPPGRARRSAGSAASRRHHLTRTARHGEQVCSAPVHGSRDPSNRDPRHTPITRRAVSCEPVHTGEPTTPTAGLDLSCPH